MSKTLYLLRHAKAEPRAAGQHDHNRELTGRGRREAAALGSRAAAGGELPELVIASTSARAVQTAALWAKAAGLPEQLVVRRDGIYLADAEAVLRLVHGLDEALQRVLLVGHNPTFSELATGLSGRFIALPTGAMAVLSIEGAWTDTARRDRPPAAHRPRPLALSIIGRPLAAESMTAAERRYFLVYREGEGAGPQRQGSLGARRGTPNGFHRCHSLLPRYAPRSCAGWRRTSAQCARSRPQRRLGRPSSR